MSIFSIMTTLPIATQTPMDKIFGGEKACYVFWMVNCTYMWKMITSGTGMALYRLLCFKYLFKRNIDTKSVARKTLAVEWMVSIGAMLTLLMLFNIYGWEEAIQYRFCKDTGYEQVKILNEYKNKEYEDILYKVLRTAPGIVGRCCLISELVIYLWIVFHLWKHDERNYQENIITQQMRQERNHKNVITLKGQVTTFIIETTYGIYLAVHTANPELVDASFRPISMIIGSTVLSVVQLFSSHEMMRFIKRQF